MKNKRLLLIAAIVMLFSLLLGVAAVAEEPVEPVTPVAPTSIKMTLDPTFTGLLEYRPSYDYEIESVAAFTYEPADADLSGYRFKWSCSDSSVATLGSMYTDGFSNTVNAKKPGKVTISLQLVKEGAVVQNLSASMEMEFKEIPVTKIYFSQDTLEITDSETLMDYLTVEPANATYGMSYLKWTSDNTTVVSVYLGGYVYPKTYGTAVITAKALNQEVQASITVICKDNPITKITFDGNAYEVYEYEEDIYVLYSVEPWNHNDDIKWISSDPSVVEVSGNRIYPLKAGTATVTAYSVKNPAARAECVFTVKPQVKVTALSFVQSEIPLDLGDKLKLKDYLTVTPADYYEGNISWTSSDPAVAEVDDNGWIEAKKAGTTVVTVSANHDRSIKAECTIKVTENPITALSFTKTAFTLNVKDTVALSSYVSVTPYEYTGDDYIWQSSDVTVATVTESGEVTAQKPGTATITLYAESNRSIKAECTITVVGKPITALAFSQSAFTLDIGEEYAVVDYLVITPADYTDKEIVWTSSDPQIAKVENGVVRGMAPGTAVITAAAKSDRTIKAECTVTVAAKHITALAFSQNAYALDVSEDADLSSYLVVTPADFSDDAVLWSTSDPRIVTVETGYIEALKPGTAVITAVAKSDRTIKAEFTVTVIGKPITALTFSQSACTLDIFEEYAVVDYLVITPADYTDEKIVWTSSDPKIVKVDNGVVRGMAPGTAVITAAAKSNRSIKAECTVTVAAKHITALTFSQSAYAVDVYDSADLSSYLVVTPANYTDDGIIWTSSDPQVVKVDTGYIEALKPGTAVITAAAKSDRSIKAECTITVTDNHITALEFTQSAFTLQVAETMGLADYLAITPVKYADDNLGWTSSDITIVEVDYNGNITCKNPGQATVTVSAVRNPEVKAVATITVEAVNATAVSFSQSTLEMEQGDDEIMLKLLKVTPSNAMWKDISFSTSDPDAVTLDDNDEYGAGFHKMYAAKVGTSTITATWTNYDGTVLTAKMTVTVKAPKIESFSFARTEYTLSTSGKSLDLTRRLVIKPDNRKWLSVFPDDPDNLIWDSSDATIASVSEDGMVIPMGVGTATISVTYAYDTSVTASVTVNVKGTPVKKIALNRTKIEFASGTTRSGEILLTIQPANAYIKEIYWTVTDTGLIDIYGEPEANVSGTTAGIYDTRKLTIQPNTNGRVGTAKVKVYVNDGTTVHRAVCTVTITAPKKQLSLKNTKVDLSLVKAKGQDNINNTYYFSTWNSVINSDPNDDTCYDANDFTWKSSNKSVARISKDGTITALKKGKTVITGTCKQDKTVKVKCTVNIKTYLIKEISAIDRTIYVGDVINLLGSNAWIELKPVGTSRIRLYYDTLTIRSSDTTVVSVKNNKLSALKPGTATITVKANDGSKKKTTFVVNVIEDPSFTLKVK